MLKILSVILDKLAADPVTPAEGEIWYNDTDDKLRVNLGGTTCTVACEDQLPPQIECGSIPVVDFAIGANGTQEAAEVFPTAFAAAPSCVTITACSSNGCIYSPNIISGSVTATGFTVDLGTNDDSDLVEVKWMAIA